MWHTALSAGPNTAFIEPCCQLPPEAGHQKVRCACCRCIGTTPEQWGQRQLDPSAIATSVRLPRPDSCAHTKQHHVMRHRWACVCCSITCCVHCNAYLRYVQQLHQSVLLPQLHLTAHTQLSAVTHLKYGPLPAGCRQWILVKLLLQHCLLRLLPRPLHLLCLLLHALLAGLPLHVSLLLLLLWVLGLEGLHVLLLLLPSTCPLLLIRQDSSNANEAQAAEHLMLNSQCWQALWNKPGDSSYSVHCTNVLEA